MSNCPFCNLDPRQTQRGQTPATANDQRVFFAARGKVFNGSSPPPSWC